jgi:hypothetical protein
MEVKNQKGEIFTLTPKEEKFLKAIKRLEKLNQGRLVLFGNGLLDVRMGGISNYRSIYSTSIYCEGGDGGDNFD